MDHPACSCIVSRMAGRRSGNRTKNPDTSPFLRRPSYAAQSSASCQTPLCATSGGVTERIVMLVNSGGQRKRTGMWLVPIPSFT